MNSFTSAVKSIAKKYNDTSLILRIAIGLVIGAVLALLCPGATWLEELGNLFVGALKGVAPVLVFVIVTSALAQGSSKLDRRFGTVVWLYMLTTFIAATLSVITSMLFPQNLVLAEAATADVIPQGLGDVLHTLLANIVSNPLSAIMNGNYIGILMWACLFGLAMKSIATDGTKKFLSDTSDAVSQIVRWVINLAPFGIMGLVFNNVASNGLSITEGLHLFADNEAFEKLFGDFKRKYGLRCILQGMMAQWPSEEEKWAFWARLIHHYCGQYRPTPVMEDLKAIVGEKDYFVVTSNGEGHFELCGFDPTKIYEIEGNWFTMQCARPCHDTLYSSLEVAEKLSAAEQGGHVPAELVPRCPKCGGPMDIHMGAGQRMIPDTAAQARFQNFLKTYHGKKLVVLELGIGWRNQLIKAPMMRLVAGEPNATYVTINLGEIYIADNIKEKSFGLDGRLDELLPALREACEA